jgi:hypothetical protein
MLDEGAEGERQAEIARTLGLGNASREEVNELMAALLGYTGTADDHSLPADLIKQRSSPLDS